VAEITALESLLTAFVDTVNDAVMAPAVIVTLLPTIALKLDDVSETVVPPVGAGLVNVSVPVVEVPPITGDTDQDIELGIGARTVTNAL